MKIELAENIVWDTDSQEQSNEAYAWLSENVTSKLGGADMLPCEVDENGRPLRWVYSGIGFRVIVEREYVNAHSWGKKSDNVKFETES